MNWGIKILILFSGFVALIITMVTISMRQKDIHLVTEKYYEKEIAYQSQIDIENNAAALSDKPAISYEQEIQVVKVSYPKTINKSDLSGNILFYRPSDANKDFVVKVKPDEEFMQEILVGHLEKGFWRIKMEWSQEGENYFIEDKLILK